MPLAPYFFAAVIQVPTKRAFLRIFHNLGITHGGADMHSLASIKRMDSERFKSTIVDSLLDGAFSAVDIGVNLVHEGSQEGCLLILFRVV